MSTALARTAAQSTAVVLATDAQLRDFLMERRGEFAAIAKSSGVEAERLVLELVGVARRKPEILDCTPDSIMTFMFDVSKTGLVIGKGCYAVPVKDHGVAKLECWIGAFGMRELAIYGKAVRDVFAEVVYEGDIFEEILGLYPDIKHRRGPNAGDPKKLTHAYGVAVFSQTIRRHVLLTRAQIEALRKKNRADTTSPKSPWVTHPEAMWKAKATLAIAKTLPQNPRMAAALAMAARNEGIEEDDLDPALEVRPISAPARAAAPEAASSASEFEVVEEERAIVTLPNWRAHPLANRPIISVETGPLEVLYGQLKEAADPKYRDLTDHIAAQLDERRGAA